MSERWKNVWMWTVSAVLAAVVVALAATGWYPSFLQVSETTTADIVHPP